MTVRMLIAFNRRDKRIRASGEYQFIKLKRIAFGRCYDFTLRINVVNRFT